MVLAAAAYTEDDPDAVGAAGRVPQADVTGGFPSGGEGEADEPVGAQGQTRPGRSGQGGSSMWQGKGASETESCSSVPVACQGGRSARASGRPGSAESGEVPRQLSWIGSVMRAIASA